MVQRILRHRVQLYDVFAVALIVLLTACGGSNDLSLPRSDPSPASSNESMDNRVLPARSGSRPHSDAQPIRADIRSDNSNRFLGIGPAFDGERPNLSDLRQESEAIRGAVTIRSGSWSGPEDGTFTANDVLAYLNALQRQARQEAREQGGMSGDLMFLDISGPRVLRINRGATVRERRWVESALRNFNTSVPWNSRISLGPNVANNALLAENRNQGEIHLHFTNGKGNWPENIPDPGDGAETLGVGGVYVVGTHVRTGYVFIDRDAFRTVGLNESDSEFAVLHEIFHAYGIGTHVDPNLYPGSILVPSISRDRRSVVPRIYLSLDGEALTLERHFATPGTKVDDFSIEDLGDWEEDGFHIVGYDAGRPSNSPLMEYGASYRHGFAKPWAFGPATRRRFEDNPELRSQPVARWTGTVLGFTDHGQTVSGDTSIVVQLREARGAAEFTELEQWGVREPIGAKGSGQRWRDGDLFYSLELQREDGVDVFVSAFSGGDDPGVVTGGFVGPFHEGAVGTLEHPHLSGAFGARR
ncbi:MAG: hypothetical protein OXC68_09885 [Aestuariivita sp.]|nr:hypothetical protein [Aestuariivita sp.]